MYPWFNLRAPVSLVSVVFCYWGAHMVLASCDEVGGWRWLQKRCSLEGGARCAVSSRTTQLACRVASLCSGTALMWYDITYRRKLLKRIIPPNVMTATATLLQLSIETERFSSYFVKARIAMSLLLLTTLL